MVGGSGGYKELGYGVVEIRGATAGGLGALTATVLRRPPDISGGSGWVSHGESEGYHIRLAVSRIDLGQDMVDQLAETAVVYVSRCDSYTGISCCFHLLNTNPTEPEQ